MYVKRDVGSISTIIKQSQNLSAADKATVKTALMNKIGTLQTPSKRLSASGAAGTALGGLASVGANGLVSGILEKIESLFRREEELHEMQRRAPLSASSFKPSGTGVTSQVLGGLAGGAASGLVGNLLSEFESLFRRAEELSVIAGRAIKNEYLALGTLLTTLGGAMYASGGKKEAPAAKTTTESLVDSVKSTFKSDIRDFIAKAEKEDAKH
ncbi:hypothetical protein DL93DRAFT_2100858 [Clavulina sp. PMI_390]|nr:hypothetical protein DL93DRAFT_2100858 [Clavulina sp. PMI_390]